MAGRTGAVGKGVRSAVAVGRRPTRPVIASVGSRRNFVAGPRTELALRRETHPDARFVIDGEFPDVSVTANEMLASVFTNVLNNAVQHHPDGAPEVRLTGAVEDGMAEVRVADDGPGIPDEAKERVFAKGEKGANSEGTGIGLYLVRTLVEQYGGSVHVEDNEPTGAVFVVRLPLAD